MLGCPQVYVQLICVFREFLHYVYYLFIREPRLLFCCSTYCRLCSLLLRRWCMHSGMSMRVERVPLARVKAKLQAARQTAGTWLDPQTQRQRRMRV